MRRSAHRPPPIRGCRFHRLTLDVSRVGLRTRPSTVDGTRPLFSAARAVPRQRRCLDSTCAHLDLSARPFRVGAQCCVCSDGLGVGGDAGGVAAGVGRPRDEADTTAAPGARRARRATRPGGPRSGGSAVLSGRADTATTARPHPRGRRDRAGSVRPGAVAGHVGRAETGPDSDHDRHHRAADLLGSLAVRIGRHRPVTSSRLVDAVASGGGGPLSLLTPAPRAPARRRGRGRGRAADARTHAVCGAGRGCSGSGPARPSP
jgi:hypothetical protein